MEHIRFARPRVGAAAAVVAALLAAGLLALSPTQSRRSLLDQLQRAANPSPAAVAARPVRFVRHATRGYVVAMKMTPNRASGPIAMSLRVSQHGRPVRAVRVSVGFSMPSMRMWNVYTAALSALPDGPYASTIPVLGMAGDWRLRIEVNPRSGRPFAIDIDDRIAA